MSIGVVKKTSLQHLVHGGFNTGDQVRRRVGNLLCLGVVVHWVSIQGDFTNWDKGVITMGPDLGDIENIKAVCFSILLGHSLDKPVP